MITIAPSASEEWSRIAATTTNATTAPANRASTSNALPIFSTSLDVTATTSPVATVALSSLPRWAECRTTSCWVRLAAVIQLVTAIRWRSTPASAAKAPSPNRAAAARRRSVHMWSAAAWTPAPSAAGTMACASIQRMPHRMPIASVRH